MSYELIEFYHNSNDKIRNQIIDLWVNNQALTVIEALNRVNYVVCAIRHIPSDKIIGVSTAKIIILPKTNDIYYFYGMFIDKEHRGADENLCTVKPGISKTTFNVLKRQNNKYIKGVAATIENERITDKMLQRYGWTKLEDNSLKFRLFFKNFEDNNYY